MPSIKIERQTSLSAKDSFDRISKLLSEDKDLLKLDPKLLTKFDPASLGGTAEGSMFKARMNVAEVGSGSTVVIAVDLPFHLALAKGMVEKTLRRKLEEVLT